MAANTRWTHLLRASGAGLFRVGPASWPRWPASTAAVSLVCWLVVLLACAPPSSGQPFGQATFEDQMRRETIATIPFDRLSGEARAKIESVVSKPTIYRRMPVTVVDTDPDLYLFLIRYPEVVVNIWQLMGVTKVTVRRSGDFTFDASDGAGTVSHVELVYGDRHTHVMYAEGAYEGPLFRRLIRGRCVLVLKCDYYDTMDQRTYVTNQLDMFVQLDNVGAELLAKTLHPLVGKTADQNFVESTRFLGQVSLAAETKAAKIQQLAGRLSSVDPKVRDKFAMLASAVGQRAAARDGVHFTGVEDGEAPDAAQDNALQANSDLSSLSEAMKKQRKPLRLRR